MTTHQLPQIVDIDSLGAQDATVEDVDGREIVILRVPTASRKVRPVHINGNPYMGTYVRRNSGDYLCTKPEVDRMMREASDAAADSAILVDFTWDDLDSSALARFRRLYQTRASSSPWNTYDDRAFMRAIGGFRRDRATGKEVITAGLLMLGRDEALREWRSRHLIDFRTSRGEDDPNVRWDDRVAWEGNLLGAYEAIYPRLTNGLPVPFRLEGGMRVDESQVHVVLREALVNLLVHADYSETQASLVLRSSVGYLFRNPGSSRVPEVDMFVGNRSDPRNPELVRMIRLIGLAEEAGTGIPKIIRAWRDLGFQMPRIDAGTERYEFTLALRPVHSLSDDDRAWPAACGQGWSEAEQLALVLARHEGDVDNFRLRELTQLHPSDVTKVLVGLRDRGLLGMIGGGRGARYELSGVAKDRSGGHSSQGPEFVQEVRTLGSEVDSEEAEVRTLGPEVELVDILRKGGGAAQAVAKWTELEQIAAAAHGKKRLSEEERAALLLALCAVAPLSLPELAQLLHRNPDVIRRALQPLIRSGAMQFAYPGTPNHPHQRYLTVAR